MVSDLLHVYSQVDGNAEGELTRRRRTLIAKFLLNLSAGRKLSLAGPMMCLRDFPEELAA